MGRFRAEELSHPNPVTHQHQQHVADALMTVFDGNLEA